VPPARLVAVIVVIVFVVIVFVVIALHLTGVVGPG
jgi:hypothetical protein